MDENKIEPSIFRYILKHTKMDQCYLLLLTLISMPFVYVSLEVPKVIINSALGGVDIPDQIFGYPMDQIKYLFFLCAAFLILVLINGGLKYVINVYRGVLGERMLRRFRFDLFSRILRFPLPKFKQLSQGEIIPMVTAETEPLGGFIGDAFALPAFQLGLLLTYLAFIFNQDVWLGLAAIALYPPQLYIIPKLQRKVNNLAKQRVQAVRRLADKVGETVSGIADIHVNDTSTYEKAHVSSKLARIYDIRFDIYKKKFFIKFLNNFLAQLTPFFFYGIGGYFVIKGELSLGALVAVLAAYKDLASPWKELLKFYQVTEDVRVKYKQIIDQFQPDDMLDPALQQRGDQEITLADHSITGTSISYNEDEFVKILDGVNFEIKSGEHVAILGLGGSGRGVLTQLLARLLQPNFGRLQIADQNIADLPESLLGKTLAYVDQRSHVFTGTVRDNLFYSLKNQPGAEPEYSAEELKQRQLYIDNSRHAANPFEDLNANWINHSILEQGDDAFFEHVLETLQITDMADDVYQFGLFSSIDQQNHPQLSRGVLDARRRLRERLEQEEYHKLVESMDADRYNSNMTAAENLFFGMPVQRETSLLDLLSEDVVDQVIERVGLKQPMIDAGRKAAKLMVDIFADVPETSPMFERFSFISVEDLPDLARISKLDDSKSAAAIKENDQQKLLRIAFRLVVARHRLGLITEDLQEKIIRAHIELKAQLGDDNTLINFNSLDKVSSHLSLQDNILFGRVAYGQANAQQKVGRLIEEVINELGLKNQIIEVGLNYAVGVSGAKLTSAQRLKLTLSRALIKNPQILIINEATAVLDSKVEKELLHRLLNLMRSKTVIWVMSSTEYIDQFDGLIVLDKGRLVASGAVEQVKSEQEIMRRLGS